MRYRADMPFGFSEHPIAEQEARTHTLEALWERVDGIEAGRQQLIDALWARLPTEITEFDYTASSTELNVSPTTNELVRVSSVVVFCGTATGGVLTLGPLVFPVPGSPSRFVNWVGLNIMLPGSGPRKLTCTTASKLGLIICGSLVPLYGHT